MLHGRYCMCEKCVPRSVSDQKRINRIDANTQTIERQLKERNRAMHYIHYAVMALPPGDMTTEIMGFLNDVIAKDGQLREEVFSLPPAMAPHDVPPA